MHGAMHMTHQQPLVMSAGSGHSGILICVHPVLCKFSCLAAAGCDFDYFMSATLLRSVMLVQQHLV
jgi:hypothetical protein